MKIITPDSMNVRGAPSANAAVPAAPNNTAIELIPDLTTHVVAGAGQVDVVGILQYTDFSEFIFELRAFNPAASAPLYARIIDTDGTILTANNYNIRTEYAGNGNAGWSNAAQTTAATEMYLTGGNMNAGANHSGIITLRVVPKMDGQLRPRIKHEASFMDGNNTITNSHGFSFYNNSIDDIHGLRFYFPGTTIDAGSIFVYGVRR